MSHSRNIGSKNIEAGWEKSNDVDIRRDLDKDIQKMKKELK
jgi:hypothetical protein